MVMIDFEIEELSIVGIRNNLDHVEKTVQEERQNLSQAEKTLEQTQTAQEVLQLVAQAVQQKAHEKIGTVVSSCLQAVFGEQAYEFKILFERKRGKTEAQLRFCRGGLDIDPLTASGGGVVDVAAFALRVACLLLHRPRLSKLIVLDEPFRFVSAAYQENIRSMLEELSKDLKLQIIMVTHNETIATGKVIRL